MSVHRGDEPEARAHFAVMRHRHSERLGRMAIRLIVKLEHAARSQLHPGQRILMLTDLVPKVSALALRIPKPVVSSRRFEATAAGGQTLEQRLCSLTIKNLKLALDDLDRSEAARTKTSAFMRSWLFRNLFDFLARQIEYAVRHDRACPAYTWAKLNGLYFYFSVGEGTEIGLSRGNGGEPFEPLAEYKRLLLLGLVQRLVPLWQRSPLLYEAIASLAAKSRLEHPAKYAGAFDLFVVEISRDAPPWSSGVLDDGFNGWVLEPAPEFMELISGIRGWH